MTGAEAATWGALGALGVEALEFAAATRRNRTWPWLDPAGPDLLPLAATVIIRVAVGAIVAGALGAAVQVSGAFGALTAGIAAPLLIQQTAGQVPHDSPAAGTSTGPAAQPPHQITELPRNQKPRSSDASLHTGD